MSDIRIRADLVPLSGRAVGEIERESAGNLAGAADQAADLGSPELVAA
jgi:hypothetical protein